MFTTSFWRATAERTVATAAQSALALLGADGLGVLEVNWVQVASVSALAAVAAVLKALAASQTGASESPSLGGGEVLEDEVEPLPDVAVYGYGDGI